MLDASPALTPESLLERRHWIFDLDGTLTKPVHDFAAMRRELGVPDAEDILGFIAKQLPEQQARLQQQLLTMEQRMAHQAEPSEGAVELVQKLAAQGIALGILTRNQRDCVHIILNKLGIDEFFTEGSIIAAQDALPKPHPEGIQRLLDLWQARPDDSLIIGDFHYDLEAGQQAGVLSVHYAADRQERWPQCTDLLLHDFQQLLRML